MTRKHYIQLAKIISDTSMIDDVNDIKYIDKDLFISKLCTMLAQDNNLFNRSRFENACE